MSYKKIDSTLSKTEEKESSAITQVIEITEPVSGDVENNIMCVNGIPSDVSEEAVVNVLEQMKLMLGGGISSKVNISGKVDGNISFGIGNLDFSKFSSKKPKAKEDEPSNHLSL